MIETFMRTRTRSNASGLHCSSDRAMQADSDSFMSPFLLPLFLSEPQRVIQPALHLVLMSWFSMFGVPHRHPLLSLITASQSTKTWPPWPRSSQGPAGDPRGQHLVSHHLPVLPPPPSSSTVRRTPHTYARIHTYTKLIHKNTNIQWFPSSQRP